MALQLSATKNAKKSAESALRSNPRRGRLFIISAPSGAGKTTLCTALRQRFQDISYSVSYTTRHPRPGEKDGRDYYFITKEAFEENIRNGLWAEWALVYGNYYGTSARVIDQKRKGGEDILLEVDVQGAFQLLEHYPDSISIFIMPPSLRILRERLTARGSDAPEVIEKRLSIAASEMRQSSVYRHIIVNDQLDIAKKELIGIVARYRDAKSRQ